MSVSVLAHSRRRLGSVSRSIDRAVGSVMEQLELRTLLSTFTDNGTTLNLSLQTNEALSIVSAGSDYSLTLTGGTWSGTDDANVAGNGTNTLTVTSAGIAAFTTGISIADSGTGSSVTFADSGTNFYSNNFTINLTDSPAIPAISFTGTSDFTTFNLDAETSSSISVTGAGAVLASTGNITLIANQGGTTSGTFDGIDIDGEVATDSGTFTLNGTGGSGGGDGINISAGVVGTASSNTTIIGTGGNDGGDGLYMGNSAFVSTTNGGDITITGTATGGDVAINMNGGGNEIGTFGTTGNITLVGDSMNLAGAIGATTNAVTLEPQTTSAAIDLGDTSGILNLSQADLNTVTAGTLQIGTSTDTGQITVAAMSVPSTVTNLDLVTGRNISVNAALTATGSQTITLTANPSGLTSGNFDGIDVNAGITSADGAILLNGNAGTGGSYGILVATSTSISSSGLGAITLNGTGAGSGDGIFLELPTRSRVIWATFRLREPPAAAPEMAFTWTAFP